MLYPGIIKRARDRNALSPALDGASDRQFRVGTSHRVCFEKIPCDLRPFGAVREGVGVLDAARPTMAHAVDQMCLDQSALGVAVRAELEVSALDSARDHVGGGVGVDVVDEPPRLQHALCVHNLHGTVRVGVKDQQRQSANVRPHLRFGLGCHGLRCNHGGAGSTAGSYTRSGLAIADACARSDRGENVGVVGRHHHSHSPSRGQTRHMHTVFVHGITG